MKRLLEWKQRMLQSPLRKKQGQQNLVPSSFELQSAALKRPTQLLGGDVRAPPERPPLPEEYRRRVLDEVHAPGEVWTGQRRLSGGPLHEPIAGRPHEMQDAPGPDLIRKHAVDSPLRRKICCVVADILGKMPRCFCCPVVSSSVGLERVCTVETPWTGLSHRQDN